MTVILSGNPRPGSRTRQVAEALGRALSERLGRSAPEVVDVAELGPRLWTPDDPQIVAALDRIRNDALLIIAMPTYKGSYPGVLKALLDLLPHRGLADVAVLTVVTAGVPAQAEAAQRLLHELLGELGATPAAPGVVIVEGQLADINAVALHHADRLARALDAYVEVPA